MRDGSTNKPKLKLNKKEFNSFIGVLEDYAGQSTEPCLPLYMRSLDLSERQISDLIEWFLTSKKSVKNREEILGQVLSTSLWRDDYCIPKYNLYKAYIEKLVEHKEETKKICEHKILAYIIAGRSLDKLGKNFSIYLNEGYSKLDSMLLNALNFSAKELRAILLQCDLNSDMPLVYYLDIDGYNGEAYYNSILRCFPSKLASIYNNYMIADSLEERGKHEEDKSI